MPCGWVCKPINGAIFFLGDEMKITEQHVSEEFLTKLIYTLQRRCDDTFEENVLKLALELKQRREEDRQREADK